MADHETVSPETTPTEAADDKGGRRSREGHCTHGGRGGHRRRGGIFGRLFGAALFLGLFVGLPYAVAHAASGHGCGFGHHDAPKSAEELRGHLGKGAGFLLDRVDATDAQEAEVGAVLDRVAPELWALKDDKDALHQDFRAALTAPEVNGEEVEGLRKEALVLADDASRIVLGGVVEVARILTPEQRSEVAEAAAKFHGE